MLIEMHCHTAEHSPCSSVAAVELVRQVFAKGLQGLVLTDHHYLWPRGELAELHRAAGVPGHFHIMSGQELHSADFGDVLVYGAAETLPRKTSVLDVRRRYPKAAIIWAHPYRDGRVPEQRHLLSPFLDGIEIFNSNHTVRGNSKALQDWHHHRFTAIGGSDTHGASYAGLYPTLFDHPVATVEELAAEIMQGRCRPFLKEIPRSGANSLVTEVTIGAKGSNESRERIIIREMTERGKWDSAERAFRIMQAFAGHGFTTGKFRIPQPIDDDPGAMTLIEQGVRGKSLFDKLLSSTVTDGQDYLHLTARWLARLHGLRLLVTPPNDFLPREESRLDGYLARFTDIGHRHMHKAAEIVAKVREEEQHLAVNQLHSFVQGHGDFHPKNVIVGQDSQDNRDTVFIAAIDFESSYVMPPAFDVGWFLAQFRNQFFPHPHILAAFPDEDFLGPYLQDAGDVLPVDFLLQVELFRARTNLSVAAYFIKLGLGESGDIWRLLVEAERALTHL